MIHNDFSTRKVRLYYRVVGLFHFFLQKRGSFKAGVPRKILLGNFGSLGDAVLSSGVIAEIREALPGCQIGLAISEESKIVCTTSPFVDWIHVVRRPFMRPEQTIWQKIADFLRFILIDQPRAAKEIGDVGYDVSIELRPFFPNFIPICWKAKIPTRIGFLTGVNGKLLNLPADWKGGQYIPHCYWPLLEQIGMKKRQGQTLMPKMILKESSPRLDQKPYLLFHLCSSNSVKELPIEFWRIFYSKCKEWGWPVYFTGKGDREFRIIEEVCLDRRENLCNKLSWNQLVQYTKECRGLVSVDSVPIHLAASFGTPTVALFWGTVVPALWTPPETLALGIEKPLRTEDVLQVLGEWR